MLKNCFRLVLKFILVMFFGFLFATSASATINENGAIIENNSFATAYPIGYWQYHASTVCMLEAGETEAYFSFTANSGDRVYASAILSQDYVNSGMTIQTFNNNQVSLAPASDDVITSASVLPFIFANASATSNSQTFFIRVTRGSYVGDMFFPISINNRISSGMGTFNFTGTASNTGNPNILTNPNGVDSSVIYMDLTNNTTIPNGAIVKSFATTGTLNPSNLGGITHKILSAENNVWYTAIVSGTFGLTTSNNLKVAKKWSFKYNFKGTSSSKMSNVKAKISYEYDLTNQFQ
ncbi:hypothetical protein [Arcobacter defluvii]|uniref:Uncharacterized protein n=1 Tax=Arcobacter defluvii TaxID=873191 RepID=A0AAE7BI75_9BACT|nr:hypothetical protein [Arcobacter defluvii]QKF78419.1 hypothetical protein ADFLV_2431 [Arcobacter defluvii]RXI30796.1 hypothetical protein CP964_11125 [Arcobacter defluvii]